jgi:hypothetical protein
LDDAHLRHLGRAFGPVWRHDKIHSGPSHADHFAQRLDTASGARPSDSLKSKPFDNSCNDFSILMLTDKNMRLHPSVCQRHHELTFVPEGNDDAFASLIQRIN